MSKNINELEADERQALVNALEDLVPAYALKGSGPHSYTWTTTDALWRIEIAWNQGRYVVTGGDQKFVRFDNDTVWLGQVLRHFGAIE